MINLKTLKDYYKNSPRRIGLTWFGIHLFFLIVALIWLQAPFWDLSGLKIIPVLVYFSPILPLSMILGNIASSFFLVSSILNIIVFLASPTYYILFFFMLFKAKNTSAKSFIIISRIFLVWFLISLVFSFITLFDFMSSNMTL